MSSRVVIKLTFGTVNEWLRLRYIGYYDGRLSTVTLPMSIVTNEDDKDNNKLYIDFVLNH